MEAGNMKRKDNRVDQKDTEREADMRKWRTTTRQVVNTAAGETERERLSEVRRWM